MEREYTNVYFTCMVCNPHSEDILFSHLRTHLRMNEMVQCPFKNCNYRTNAYSLFSAHKSRQHLGSSNYNDDVMSVENTSAYRNTICLAR